jgi:hypothetical protein
MPWIDKMDTEALTGNGPGLHGGVSAAGRGLPLLYCQRIDQHG